MKHHDVMIRTAIAQTSGDGKANHYPPPRDDLATLLDLDMSGTAAESLFDANKAPADPSDPEAPKQLSIRCVDHGIAMHRLWEHSPEMGHPAMAAALWESHERCLGVILEQRAALEVVAKALHAKPDQCVPGDVIEQLLEEHWRRELT